MASEIWTEKYRPSSFSEIVGQDNVIKKVEALTNSLNIPHLLFAGPAGTGKSTLALVIVKDLFKQNWRENYLELNASVSKDTPLIVKMDGRVKRTTFDELDKLYFSKNEGNSAKNTEDMEVLTIDKNYKVKWAMTSKIIRHKAEKILRVKFEGGGILDLTGNHSIMFLGEKGLYSKKASEIKEGDYLFSFVSNVSGNLAKLSLEEFHPKDITSRVKIIDDLQLNAESAWALGLYTAEGAVGFRNGTSGQIIFTLGTHETPLISRIRSFANNLGLSIYENLTSSGFDRTRLSACQIRMLNNQLAKFMKKEFYDGKGHRAKNKRIPSFIFESGPRQKIGYLKGLSDGDGTGKWDSLIRISSVSQDLLTDSVWLARMSGIESSIFNREARFIWKGGMGWKKSDLINGDVIINLLKKMENKINYNWRYELRHQLYEGKGRISKRFLAKILEKIKMEDLNKKEIKSFKILSKLVATDLHPVKVKKIELIDYNDFVYDVSVPNNETFFAGNIPVLLHNSDERGINVVREKVKNFARTKSLGNVPFKIIFLDEADALTPEAQQALRRTMENYSATCRFILSCNYSSKIIDPIQSRCAIFRFKLLEKKDIDKVIQKIAGGEKLTISPDALELIYEGSDGDCRRVINILQSTASISPAINYDLVSTVISGAKPKDIRVVLDYAISGDFQKSREKLLDIMLKEGISGQDVIKAIQKEIWNLPVEPEVKVKLTEKTGEAEFRIVEGSDPFIQLQSLLASFVLAGLGL